MKKLVFTLGLCLVASISFGQKKAVADALKLAKDSRPNFTEARKLIKGALDHAETKNDPKTWYTAGQIENFQFDKENTKSMLGQQSDEEAMYSALIEIYPYFLKSYELDNIPDAKGKTKPKYSKDIKSILKVNLSYCFNGGAYYYDKRDYKKALDFFNQIVEFTDSPIMKDGESPTGGATVDSLYIYANYYAATAVLQINDHDAAKQLLTRASKYDFRRLDVYQLLAEEYKNTQDTVNWEKTLEEGVAFFPKEEFFLFHLIGIYISTNRNDKAVDFIQMAIKNNPSDDQLYNVAGRVYETGFNDYAKAEEFFKKSIEINAGNAEAQTNMGRIYFNQGVNMLDEASDIADVKKYNEEKEKAMLLFKKALPYFEASFKIDPAVSDNKIALRSIYYNLGMGDKFEEMDKLMNMGN